MKSQQATAVLRDCEICGKFTFFFREKFNNNRKYSVTKFATSQSRGTLPVSGELYAENLFDR